MRILILCLSLLFALPAFAVQPDEVLSDPALEARARDISKVLRCPVCQGETIDESNAPISRDLRIMGSKRGPQVFVRQATQSTVRVVRKRS